ncbi:DNA primase [Lactobacillus paragasseri]|uniref:DNA primase n=1 Tax=Lactobacillus paragasseri TaxID=2107999 RepID=UPI00217DAF73|nr:DNA primase [Lactobacillus paragasseri]UWI43489.1 DNA primase [Lactobacillus paragasseri]UWI44732.1 DNA primase [Lactobacillus paragasseri]
MAGRIPEQFIDEVRNSADIVDVISQYVSLEKKGKDYVGLCPFHQENTPSFTVNEEKQFFYCFGCHKGGNVFKFLMYQDHLTFPESVKKVAELAHLQMPEGYGEAAKPLSPLKKMYRQATEFYQHILLTTKVGERALKYARKRELTDDLLKHFKVGYAPDSDNILLTYLKQKDYTDDDLRESGLFVESQDGQLFDRFRDRLMFPLGDESGYTVGFSGRRISNDKTIAKYMNSPETKIFNKSKLLFHFAEAKKAARSEKHLILYEGYMDVIAAYKAGIQSGVASMGTSLTTEQVYMLRRITPNILVNYDGDPPGIHAAERATKLFGQVQGFNLGIIVLPENLDSDEYVKKYGKEKYRAEVAGALSSTDFLLERLANQYNLHNDREKLAYITAAVQMIAGLNDPVAADLYLDKLARQTGVTRESLKVTFVRERRKLQRARNHQQAYQASSLMENVSESAEPKEAQAGTDSETRNLTLDRLLYLFIHSDEARDYLLSQQFLFPDERYAKLAEFWLKYHQTHDEAEVKGFIDFIPEELQGIIINIEMIPMPPDYSKRELDDQLRALEKSKIDEQLNDLLSQLKEAQRKQDNSLELEIAQKVIALRRKKF